MTIENLLIAAALCLLPISELRGAIPYLIVSGVPAVIAFIYCTALNMLVGPIVYFFLSTLHRLFMKMKWYETLFTKFVERARHKVGKEVDKYGFLGLTVFVGIPLPVTGAWTGTLGAWILGMDRKKAILSVALGVLIAGIVVTLVMVLGVEALSIFVKKPE